MKRIRMATLLALLLLCALLLTLNAQSVYDTSGSRHHYWVGVLPGSATTIATGTVYLISASYSTAGSSGTITLSDRGSDCSAGACLFSNGVAIAANTEYAVPYEGQIAPGGLKVSGTGTVMAHIHWVTQLVP